MTITRLVLLNELVIVINNTKTTRYCPTDNYSESPPTFVHTPPRANPYNTSLSPFVISKRQISIQGMSYKIKSVSLHHLSLVDHI